MFDLILTGVSFLYKGILSLGPFILLLGILILVHEWGHFIAARWCGVTVEVFSLGFGPKILSYRKGETLYCISLFPLGGYVKMFGDNPTVTIPDKDKSRGFLSQKVPQKLLIAFGGPLMNLIFTFVAFVALGFIGMPSLPPIVGDIAKNTVAYEQGFRSGDKILSVNGEKLFYWKDVKQKIQNHENQQISVQVESTNQKIKTHSIQVASQKNPDIFTLKKTVGFVKGLTVFSQGTKIGVQKDSLAYKAGLRTFDEIQKIQGKPVRYWRHLEKALNPNYPLLLTIKRENQETQVILPQGGLLSDLGIRSPYLYISAVGSGTPAQKAGLKKGDRLVAIEGDFLKDWKGLLKKVENFKNKSFSLDYEREGAVYTVSLTPKTMYVEGHLKEKQMIGISSGGLEVLPEETIKKETFLGSLTYATSQTWQWLGKISIGLLRLVQGELSIRTLGGPVVIGRVAHSSFQSGWISFLFIMAIISLNLFFINLLPIPVLDGGHILFFTLEGLMGKPLDLKKLLIAQQFGLFFLMFFFLFTFLNDIYNWLNAW